MGSLQITLSILGILAIAGIVAHGVWKIRKGNAQQRQREQRVAENRQQQSSAFDDDGIGEVRVVKHKAEEAAEAKESVAPELSSSTSEKEDDNEHIEQMSMDLDRDDELSESLPSMRVSNEEQVDVEQTELKFDDNDEHDEEVEQYETVEEDNQKNSEDFEAVPEEVIALHVKGPVQGAVLLQMMTELGCKFGELGIFHRYENTAGTGPMIFSVANMFNPGTFDLDNMENFETEGVAFFMALPMKFDGQQAFNMMLNAAKKLATEIPQGQVLDGQRQLLTRQSIHEARQRIREFERKHSA
ncbi:MULTISPECIES: cell division protein ZipA [Idiomarina]|jgi:cell division protein ZipA|uniref:cell division protein ZipA n=1 Tax=Idiomarina TaxID=135575 RepID=UPI0006C890E0|nr:MULTISPECIES: cell division protein ZipA [Idiomarina]KPD22940.1 cell division protein [Idiomarina abyssalis]MAL84560.1 cell division protein ZipA [Idiomarina sp.]MBP59845.1 cell division protein ZipA [Idiomarina sp.]SFT50509.1 cell division protein ZipA [Idiomarina abyssalis]|tara:strand:+ start:3557 stop:4456 length:900 start_codon:yes stop_codon:yes gene_type:complete